MSFFLCLMVIKDTRFIYKKTALSSSMDVDDDDHWSYNWILKKNVDYNTKVITPLLWIRFQKPRKKNNNNHE